MIVKGCRHDESNLVLMSSWRPRTVWPSGLRRWLQVPVRKGMGSIPRSCHFFQHNTICEVPSRLQQHRILGRNWC